jgi:hypothetical protein
MDAASFPETSVNYLLIYVTKYARNPKSSSTALQVRKISQAKTQMNDFVAFFHLSTKNATAMPLEPTTASSLGFSSYP